MEIYFQLYNSTAATLDCFMAYYCDNLDVQWNKC